MRWWRLLAGVALSAVVVAGGLTGCAIDPANEVADMPAERPLAIPPVLAGEPDGSGTVEYDLSVRSGTTDFAMGGPAQTLGVNGTYLGPTIRMTRGSTVRMRVANEIEEMTTLHWHGMRVPARSDGGPHSMIQPGRTWRPGEWTVDQPAATLWYHAHPHGETAQQVYRGVAGMLILDDPAATPGALPSRYGVDDLPLIVQDKTFTDDGDLVVDPEGQASTGFLGDTLVVNGTVAPYFEVSTEAVRLRLLNASNARVYDFGFDDDRTFDVVASDGGLLPAPVPSSRIQLSPGERAEVVVRVQPGEDVALRSYPPDLGAWVSTQHRFGSGEFQVLQLRAADSLAASADVPAALADVPPAVLPAGATTRTFRISGRAINGRPMDMGRIDEVVTVDEPEVWEVMNADPQPHNFHIHDVQFRVISVDGQSPDPRFAGWKDTVYVEPRATVRLAMRFQRFTDPDWPYMFHCHLLWHEDIGIMGQFVVVEPGETAGAPPMVAHGHG